MANPKKLLASAAVAAGLLGGGVVGLVLGVPGVSGAQTTTVPESPPTTVAPDDDATTPDRPARADRENCPDKEGRGDGTTPAPGSGTGANLSLRARAAGRA